MTQWVQVEPLIDTHEQRSYWQSSSELAIGQRVRVRMTGECQTHHLGNGHPRNAVEFAELICAGRIGGPGFDGANGAIGVIVAICPAESDESPGDAMHRYYVSDASLNNRRWVDVDDFFCAEELEPLP